MNKMDIFTKAYLNIINEEINKKDGKIAFKDAALDTIRMAIYKRKIDENVDVALSILSYLKEKGTVTFTDEENAVIEDIEKLKRGELN